MILEWHGARGTMHRGVFITEGDLPGEDRGQVSVAIGRQNANLDEVKDRLAAKALRLGANAVCGLVYGQQKHSPLKLVNPLRWDTESWIGEGRAVSVPAES